MSCCGFHRSGQDGSESGAGTAIGGAVTDGTAGSVLFVGTGGLLAQDNSKLFWDDTNDRLGIGTASPAVALSVFPDTDSAAILGRARIDARTTDIMYLSHVDSTGANDYALQQTAGGSTRLNCKSGGSLRLCSNDVTRLQVNATGVAFFSATPVAAQTSGANLTNNVTSGGTDDTIANYTDLTTYATDAAAIRNNIYQLARKLKQINDGLRSYGLFT